MKNRTSKLASLFCLYLFLGILAMEKCAGEKNQINVDEITTMKQRVWTIKYRSYDFPKQMVFRVLQVQLKSVIS